MKAFGEQMGSGKKRKKGLRKSFWSILKKFIVQSILVSMKYRFKMLKGVLHRK